MYISNGGIANNATVYMYGELCVSNGGTANSTTVNRWGDLYIFSGGIANSSLINSGSMYVSSGGITNNNTIYGGLIHVSSGGTANATIVNGWGDLYIFSGGIANSSLINNGSMFVSSGGIANSTTVNSNSHLRVSSGGTATNIVWTPCVGSVWIADGAYVTFVSQYSGVYYGSDNQLLSHAALMEFKTVSFGSDMYVMSGGIANSNMVNSWGKLEVSNDGVANGTVVSYGNLYISSGGTANSTTVNSDGRLYVYSGGTANSTTVNSRGYLYVSNGGTATNTTVNSSGRTDVFSGGTANSTTVNSSGSFFVSRGGTAMSIRENGGYVSIEDGANATFVSNTFSGLKLYDSTTVHSGTTAIDTTVNSRGYLYVSSGGKANSTTVNSSGSFFVSSGGTANNTTVSSGGSFFVSRGATANSTTVNSGSLDVYSGGTANSTTVNSRGHLQVESGGMAMSIRENGGYVSIEDGANVTFVSNTFSGLVLYDYSTTVHSGTTAIDTTVNSRGYLSVSSGGMANDTTINSGGIVYVNSSGKLTGRTTIANGADVSVFYGAILDFDISNVTPGALARISDFSRVSGWSNAVFTLTVGGSQANGTYSLAENASEFNKSISVVNASGTRLGSINVGQTTTINGVEYSLNQTNGNLSVTVNGAYVVKKLPSFTGDFIGNKKSMLAVKDENGVKIYRNNGTVWSELALDEGWDIAGVGDFNGDKMDDILRVNDEGYVVGEMSQGDNTFAAQVLNLKSEGWSILGVGDFNHNGTDDVLIANPTGASETVGLLGYWESGVTWTLINGYSAEWECVATGDFNGDGKCDMLWRNSFVDDGGLTYNAYCTWIVDPPAGQSDWRMVSVANPAEWNFLCSGDFDGNGSHDIAMINGEGVVGIWGISDGYLSSWSILSAVDPSSWALAGVGDFNGDGTDDIAWSNIDTGLTGYWQINNKELTAWANIATLQAVL